MTQPDRLAILDYLFALTDPELAELVEKALAERNEE